MILEAFSERTLANMEVALDRACERLPRQMDTHEVRKQIARTILDRAEKGERSLAGLTAAGTMAVLAIAKISA